MDKILFDQIPDLFASVGNLFIEKKEELCEMDARLGDGDLGLTMSKGYGSLPDIMREEATGAAVDIGKLLMKSYMRHFVTKKFQTGWKIMEKMRMRKTASVYC